jgi:probable phosphoglycerate mutase
LPLSQSGRAQADALASHFNGWTFDRVISSPLRRTRETALAIIGAQDDNLTFDDRLLEIDYGPDEGQAETDVVARLGEAALDRWDNDAVPPPGWKVDPEALRQDWIALLREAQGTTLIVTSNGIARFVLDVVRHDGAERKLKTGAYGILEETPDGWQVWRWNERP